MEEKRNEEISGKSQESETTSKSLNEESTLSNNTQPNTNINEDTTEENNEGNEDGESKPEQGSTSLFDEIYNSEEANVILDEYDNNTDFLRICKTVDFLVQDAYTAIMYLPTSNVPMTSSMAYYTTKYRAV